MTLTSQPTCLFCEQDSQIVPLLVLEYRGVQYGICPQHLPILIHNPEQVGDKLPGYRINKEQGIDTHGVAGNQLSEDWNEAYDSSVPIERSVTFTASL